MCDKVYDSFKDYIEKRTVEDVMLDYGEQRDEWENGHRVETNDKANKDSTIKNDG